MAHEAGELLRQVRRRQGVTQRELAERAGTTQSAIARLENGQRSPTIRQLRKLLAALGEELEVSSRSRPKAADQEGFSIFNMPPKPRHKN